MPIFHSQRPDSGKARQSLCVNVLERTTRIFLVRKESQLCLWLSTPAYFEFELAGSGEADILLCKKNVKK